MAHLGYTAVPSGKSFRWVRRTRIEGDLWGPGDVPLGEEAELYRVQIKQGGEIRREVDVTTPNWTYSDAQKAGDVGPGGYVISVSQVSARFGPGPARDLVINV